MQTQSRTGAMQHHSPSSGWVAVGGGGGGDARTQRLGDALRACHVTRKDVSLLSTVEAAVAPHGVSCLVGCVFMVAETFLVYVTGTRVGSSNTIFLQHVMGETAAGDVSDREAADVRQCALESKVATCGLTEEEIGGTARRLRLARAWAADWEARVASRGLGQLAEGLRMREGEDGRSVRQRRRTPPPPPLPPPPPTYRGGTVTAIDWPPSDEEEEAGEMPPPPPRPRPPAGRLLRLLREIEGIVAESFIEPENAPVSPVKRAIA